MPFEQWYEVAGGEVGHISFAPDDPDIVYAGSIGNRLDRIDVSTGYSRGIGGPSSWYHGERPV
jgi:hypothetical protein